jgi:O-antigen/teichoic acid export membrane protein
LAQGVSLLAVPVSTRLYTPSDYGVLAVYNSLLALALIFSSFRYELAILQPREDDQSLDVLVLCVSIVIVLTLIIVALFA